MIRTLTRTGSFGLWVACFGLVFTLFTGTSSAKADISNITHERMIQELGEVALTSLTDKNISRTERENRVRNILAHYFDTKTIGKFALGTYWKVATDAQRTEYMQRFEDMVVKTYTRRFEDYSGQTLSVTGSNTSGKDFLVTSKVVQQDGPSVALEWRVRNIDGKLKVIDVVVEGVSMSVTQRSDFAAVIQQGGGNVEALLVSLRERTTQVANKQ